MILHRSWIDSIFSLSESCQRETIKAPIQKKCKLNWVTIQLFQWKWSKKENIRYACKKMRRVIFSRDSCCRFFSFWTPACRYTLAKRLSQSILSNKLHHANNRWVDLLQLLHMSSHQPSLWSYSAACTKNKQHVSWWERRRFNKYTIKEMTVQNKKQNL